MIWVQNDNRAEWTKGLFLTLSRGRHFSPSLSRPTDRQRVGPNLGWQCKEVGALESIRNRKTVQITTENRETEILTKMLIIALRKYVFLWCMYFLQIEPHVHTKHLQGRIKVRKLQPMGDGCFSRYNNELLQLSPGFSLSRSVNISLLQQVLYEAPHSAKLWHYHSLEVMSVFFWARQSHACTSRLQVIPLLVWQTTEWLLQNLAMKKKKFKNNFKKK